jgi:hypothetical protein
MPTPSTISFTCIALGAAIGAALFVTQAQGNIAGHSVQVAPINAAQVIANPQIDYDGFAKDAITVGQLRAQRRVSEQDFMRMAAEPNTIVLDARSERMYRYVHVKGAKNLNIAEVTEQTLAELIPSKNTRVLIYCNNNFDNEPAAMPSKAARASLNIYTFNTLYAYGYKNVYELGPFIDMHKTKLPMAGTSVRS